MPSTATGRAPAAAPIIGTPQRAPEAAVASRASESHWFFWVAVAAALDSLHIILGSHVPSFTGFGVTALVDGYFAGSTVLHVIANCWMGAPFVFLGFCANEGRKWAFSVALVVYGLDAALLLAAQNYLSIPFHGFILYMLYRGYAALNQPKDSKAASAL